MKKYEKPVLEVVQLRVKEDLANTTIYEQMALQEESTNPTFGTFDLGGSTI